jgi:methylenetetrahydrofolate reductase (NADPH)
MQLIRDIYAARRAGDRPVISFEFFPPKSDEGERNLLERTIPMLLQTRPDYCSVTYGAGGGTREKTLRIVENIQRQHEFTAVAHLTCVGSTREEIRQLLRQIRDIGVQNVLALRGDPPGGGEFQPTPGGFEFSSQLVSFIRAEGNFCIGVAGFPECHIACKEGKHVDWRYLKEKIDAGADFVITQLFFDNDYFYEFQEHLRREHDVKVPLVPGIIPILSGSQIKRFTALCGARIPAALAEKLETLGANDAAVTEFGIEYATRQCDDLLRHGVPGIHFYTLNKADSTVRILQNLGLAASAHATQLS